MRHFRSIVLIIAVLFQTGSGAVGMRAMTVGAKVPACPMECCAAVQQAEADSCACSVAPASEQAPATPASLPSQVGRDILPVVYWKAQESFFQAPLPAIGSQKEFAMTDAQELTTPHVQLPVLFCAILI
jgi:hypothetical protein